MATNYTSYTPTAWTPGKAITQDLMGKLEQGVQENRDDAIDLNSRVTSLNTTVQGIGQNSVPNYNGKTVWEAIQTLYLTISNATQNSSDGASAWSQIVGLIGKDELGNLKSSLKDFINAMKAEYSAADLDIKNTLGKVVDKTGTESYAFSSETGKTVYDSVKALNDALGYDADGQPHFGKKDAEENIITVLSTMNQISKNVNTVLTALSEAAPSPTYTSLANRLALMKTDIDNAKDALAAANISSVYQTETDGVMKPTTYGTLDERLEHIETILSGNTSNIESISGNINDNYVKKVDVKDNFTSTDTNLPLSAAKGKELRDMIGGTYTSANTVAGAIASMGTTAETNAKNYADANKVDKTNIYNDLDYVPAQDATDDKVLDARQGKALKDLIDSMDTAYKAADTALDGRLTAAEGAITTLNGSGEGSVINTVNTQIAAVVADAPEAFDTLKEIADWIDTHSDSAIEMQQSITDNADAIAALQDTITDENTGLAATKAIADAAAVKTEVDSALNGLDARLDAIDGGEALTGAKTLATRVSEAESAIDTLQKEPKSATEVISVSDFEALVANEANSHKDYLVGPDDSNLYKYYHIIETSDNVYEKVLISGGGSGGNSSSFIYNANDYDVLESAAENVDYYVLRADGYHHYRWVQGREIEIDEPTKHYNIALETIQGENGDVNYLNFYEFNPGVSNIITSDTDLTTIEQNRIHRILLPATGGGGTANNLRIYQITSRNVYSAYNSNLPIKLRFFFTTGEAGEGASYTITVNGQAISASAVNITSGDPSNKSYTWPVDEDNQELSTTAAAALGFYEVDISDYCKEVATYNVKLVIALDSNAAITSECSWTVQTINLNIVSNYTNNPIAQLGATVPFTFIPTGNIEKTVHIKIDGTEIGTATIAARTNTTQTYNIPAQSVGAHKLEAYLTANNGALKSGSVYRDIIWYDATSSDIILASPYRNNVEHISQYDSITIPYTVVGGNTNTYEVKYYVDDLENSINEITLSNTNAGSWTYQALTKGEHTLMIKAGTAALTFTVIAKPLDIDIAPVTNNLAIDFNPTGISNTSSKRLWTNGTYSLSVSDNFDWYNGGYGSDASGDYFLIKAGTRATFNYKMFKSYTRELNGAMTTSSTVFRDGAEMKIIFKTSAVRNAEATWFTNMGPNNTTSAAKNVGIQLNVHNGWLRTDSAEAANVKSYLYFPYSEEDRIELDININPETATNSVYCMSYEDGCPSRAYPYKVTEGLYQIADNESDIIIGSDDCDVYIYRFKIYNAALDTEEVLRNFIADGKDATTCVERYDRNSIYYDTQLNEYTPYEGVDTILDPERLAVKLPDVKILMLDTPIFTKSKKDFIKDSSLRCIHAPGGKVYPSRGKEDNWFFGNGYHAGQGTTSDKYGDAGRNVDFLFNCDGVHNPSDKVKGEAFVPGYQSYVIKGYGTDEQEEPEYCTDWKGDSGKVSLTATSIPNNFFNLKVNIASSENVNNALFQKRYNDFLLYDSPAHQRDSRIKNDMEFVPAILFVRENKVDEQGNPDGHREFADTNWHFYALGNIGDSKKTDYTRAYDPTDINEFALEISDNNTNNSQFQTGVYLKNGVRTIEPYTVVDDVDDDGKLTGTQSAKSSEEDITLETTAYLYPIDKATEWEAVDEQGKPKNMRYWGLMNEKFDGDHSFEMRYAYLGNYRDGKLVNGDKNTANTILEQNSNVWRAFYTWLITSSNQEIQNEIDQWCVRRSMAFFFAFTHYYTMIDNRAKNTFWHFAKTGKHRRVSRPVPELLHVYEVADGEVTESETEAGVWVGKFKAPEDTSAITAGVTYYTQYAFDMWAYDMDTAAGIDNNGELIFPYGKEDTDDRIDGDPTSGKVFNGAGSVFWARLRDNFTSDITSAFTSADASCFNADNLIAEFDRVQNCYPEAIWRLDVERKYIRSFTGDDGSTEDHPEPIYLTRKNTRFLGDMMQGRKKYQRRQWIKDQGVYFGSKYKMLNVMDNQFDMVCYTIANQNVMANWDLTITPYQDMYINVEYAETPITPIRAKANVPVEIDCPFTSMNESRVRIYGADYIRALAGKPIKNEQGEIIGANSLASFYFRGNDFNHTNKLRELYIGSPDSTYTNSQFVTLNLNENSPILEVLDLQNCNGLSGTLDVSGCTSLKTVNVEGTSYSSVDLPSSTGIVNLYLPETINRLVLTAAKNLTNLTMRARGSEVNSVDNLTEIIINDSDYSNKINWISIAAQALNHLTNIQLLNLRLASVDNINEMDAFVDKKKELGNFIDENNNEVSKVNLTGEINVTGNWSEVKVNTYEEVWDNKLHFNTDANKEVIEYKLSFYLNSEDALNETNVYYTTYLPVEDGMTDAQLGEDPVYIGLCDTPTKASTISKEYYFGTNPTTYYPWSGWRIIDNASAPRADMTISSNTVFVAVFGEKTRTYPLRWYLNETDNENDYVKEVSGLEYNSSYENGLAPTTLEMIQAGKTLSSLNGTGYTYKIFKGWAREPINLNSTYFNANQTAFCIYGTWEQGTESLATIRAQEELDEKKLLVLTNTNDKVLPTSSTYTVEMGYDNNFGTTIIGKNAALGISPRGEAYTGEDVNHPVLKFTQYNGALVPTIRPVNDIKPFAKMSTDGFTLAIDYQLDTDYLRSIYSNGYCILGGCYAANSGDNTAQGFAIYYDINAGVVKACFGNLANTNTYSSSDYSCAISNNYGSSKRNIVVIRHIKGTNTLQFYSGIHSQQGIIFNLNNDNFRQTLTWSNNNITSPLCFGHFTSGAFTALASVHPGVGTTIHWAKYWDTDLGHNECTLLAAWPHEKLTFALSDYSNDGTNDILVTNSRNMIFSALQLSEYGGAYYDAISISTGNTVNWGTGLTTSTNSAYKKISNQRFFLGLPIKLQSIITRTVGNAATITAVTTGFYPVYEYTTSGETIDLAFIPTYTEAGGTDVNYQSEASRAFPWYTGSNAQVFSYGTNNFLFDDVSYSAEYMNLRFSGIPIKTTSGINNVFIGYNGTDPVYNKINISSNPNGGIKRGDIFIYTYTSNNNTITNTYIYADSLDVAQGVPIVNAAEGELLYCPIGGWVKAGSWWTRTPATTYDNRATGQQPYFYIDGNTSSIRYNSTPAEGGAYFVYEFGI